MNRDAKEMWATFLIVMLGLAVLLYLTGCAPTKEQIKKYYRDGYHNGYVAGLFTCADGKDRYNVDPQIDPH